MCLNFVYYGHMLLAMNPEGLSEADLIMLFCKFKHVKLFHEIASLSSCSFHAVI